MQAVSIRPKDNENPNHQNAGRRKRARLIKDTHVVPERKKLILLHPHTFALERYIAFETPEEAKNHITQRLIPGIFSPLTGKRAFFPEPRGIYFEKQLQPWRTTEHYETMKAIVHSDLMVPDGRMYIFGGDNYAHSLDSQPMFALGPVPEYDFVEFLTILCSRSKRLLIVAMSDRVKINGHLIKKHSATLMQGNYCMINVNECDVMIFLAQEATFSVV